MDTVERLITCYWKLVGSIPEGIRFAPGRVNLIGEHTDYNNGFVLFSALEQYALTTAGYRGDDLIVMHVVDLSETVELSPSNLNPDGEGQVTYLAGVPWALCEAGYQVGAVNLALISDVPLGTGLSSFTTIEYAVMAAAYDLFDLGIIPIKYTWLAQRTENTYVGAPTGLLNQTVSTLCHAGHGPFMDCRTLETVEAPLPLRKQRVEILVLDTRTPHSHVDGEYGERRATCEQAAVILGTRVLRGVTNLGVALARLPDERMRKRVRRVVTENDRARVALEPAVKGNLVGITSLLNKSYASIRDGYEITVPIIDLAVETALAQGTLGARMAGGGFGGCITAWCPTGRAERIRPAIRDAFEKAGFLDPSWLTVVPSEGTGRLR